MISEYSFVRVNGNTLFDVETEREQITAIETHRSYGESGRSPRLRFDDKRSNFFSDTYRSLLSFAVYSKLRSDVYRPGSPPPPRLSRCGPHLNTRHRVYYAVISVRWHTE